MGRGVNMQRVFQATALALTFGLIGAAALPQPLSAQSAQRPVISTIIVEGNQRIERATILSFMQVKEGRPASAIEVNESLSTGLRSREMTGYRMRRSRHC